jgi:hypothetical protein
MQRGDIFPLLYGPVGLDATKDPLSAVVRELL